MWRLLCQKSWPKRGLTLAERNRDDGDVCKRNTKSSKSRAIRSGKFTDSTETISKPSGLLSGNFG